MFIVVRRGAVHTFATRGGAHVLAVMSPEIAELIDKLHEPMSSDDSTALWVSHQLVTRMIGDPRHTRNAFTRRRRHRDPRASGQSSAGFTPGGVEVPFGDEPLFPPSSSDRGRIRGPCRVHPGEGGGWGLHVFVRPGLLVSVTETQPVPLGIPARAQESCGLRCGSASSSSRAPTEQEDGQVLDLRAWGASLGDHHRRTNALSRRPV